MDFTAKTEPSKGLNPHWAEAELKSLMSENEIIQQFKPTVGMFYRFGDDDNGTLGYYYFKRVTNQTFDGYSMIFFTFKGGELSGMNFCDISKRRFDTWAKHDFNFVGEYNFQN